MKYKILFTVFLTCAATLGGEGFICVATPFEDPQIPDGETITYTSRVGDRLLTVTENVVIKREGVRELYEITSRSEPLDRTIMLVKDTMAIKSVHTVRKFQEVTLDSRLTVIDKKPPIGDNGVKLADFAVMTYVFRGFPFGKLKEMKIGFYGEESKRKYTFSAHYKNREKIEVNQQTIECHKIEFGMDGFWGAFLPKMKVWYSVDLPHYLVRYEGPVGPPGTPGREVELINYQVMDK
jgi:hypothetical protein